MTVGRIANDDFDPNFEQLGSVAVTCSSNRNGWHDLHGQTILATLSLESRWGGPAQWWEFGYLSTKRQRRSGTEVGFESTPARVKYRAMIGNISRPQGDVYEYTAIVANLTTNSDPLAPPTIYDVEPPAEFVDAMRGLSFDQRQDKRFRSAYFDGPQVEPFVSVSLGPSLSPYDDIMYCHAADGSTVVFQVEYLEIDVYLSCPCGRKYGPISRARLIDTLNVLDGNGISRFSAHSLMRAAAIDPR